MKTHMNFRGRAVCAQHLGYGRKLTDNPANVTCLRCQPLVKWAQWVAVKDEAEHGGSALYDATYQTGFADNPQFTTARRLTAPQLVALYDGQKVTVPTGPHTSYTYGPLSERSQKTLEVTKVAA